jgi:hypothetical protein
MKRIILIILIANYSCKNNQDTIEQNDISSKNINSTFETKFFEDTFSNDGLEKDIRNDSVKFIFKEFDLFIKNYSPDTFYYSQNKDTIYAFQSIGESIEDKLLIFKSSQYSSYSIEQSYINSILISNEGPLCTIENWKNYLSPYSELKKDSSNNFKTITYNYEKYNEFPDVSINEIKKIVKKQCGKTYEKLVENVKSVYDSPIEVYKSNYILKINIKNTTPKYIIITSIPGC